MKNKQTKEKTGQRENKETKEAKYETQEITIKIK